MAEAGRIDVSIEHKQAPEPPAQKHPNTCPSCGSHFREDELEASLRVCTQCGYHYPVKARERIAQIADPGSFREEAEDLRSADPLGFFDLRSYKERLAEAEVSTGLGDALVIGSAAIERLPCQLAVMDFSFMGGSMISVLTHPTTGGLLASFASLGDVLLAEPGALMSFAGPRVVAQTTREKLPDDFGLSESNLRFGHLDGIVPRAELRPTLARLLRLFGNA